MSKSAPTRMAQLTVSEGPNVQKLLYESETIRFCMEKCYNPEIFVLFISSPCCVSQLLPRFDSLPMHICLKSNQPLVPPKCSAVPNPPFPRCTFSLSLVKTSANNSQKFESTLLAGVRLRAGILLFEAKTLTYQGNVMHCNNT